jgi:phosphoserine phosphatase RsbU/P
LAANDMHRKTLTLVGSSPLTLEDEPLRSVLALWPAAERPVIQLLSFEQVFDDEMLLQHTGVAWVVLHKPHPRGLEQLVAVLQERQAPTIITGPDDHRPAGTPFQEHAVLAPIGTEPQVICAMLRSLWQQAVTIYAMQLEMGVLRRHQGGLCDQIGKIDEELRLAAQLQREFLPSSLPRLGDVEFRVVFRPASYVSGDIYDVIRLDEHHIGFFLADAVGHGVPAALMTMFMKRSLLPKEVHPSLPGSYRIIPPDEALSRLNRDMIDQESTSSVKTGTAVYGVIDCRTLDVQIARAGHPFPLVLRADGSQQWIEPDGAMLGVFPEETYEIARFRLAPGDRMVIYSDGVELAFPEPPQADGTAGRVATTQYTEELKVLQHGPVEEAFAKLEARLDLQNGSLHQRDDLTLICLSVADPVVVEKSESRTRPVVKGVKAPGLALG